MKVYVLESGWDDSRGVVGVYATAEAAMAAWQPKRTHETISGWGDRDRWERQLTFEWSKKDAVWEFDGAYDEWACVTAYEVEEAAETL